jgi:hypothetical protein
MKLPTNQNRCKYILNVNLKNFEFIKGKEN